MTFDNIDHEHYNYWSLTSLTNFFNQFEAKIVRVERISTHGGSIRIYIKRDKKTKIESIKWEKKVCKLKFFECLFAIEGDQIPFQGLGLRGCRNRFRV